MACAIWWKIAVAGKEFPAGEPFECRSTCRTDDPIVERINGEFICARASKILPVDAFRSDGPAGS
jgi:hypothetical protein